MLKLSDEVAASVAKGIAVVALESTIIAHGMPFPRNMEMAFEVEQTVRRNGAVPATIAIFEGQLRVGLSSAELESLARGGADVMKVSTRDIPYAVARRLPGATTVASTMRIADMAGIHVFATGGMGGVHRGGAQTLDVSNDLVEFSQSNVAVVTAGAKAILDLGLTLEVLETNGVPVVGFGTDEFPAFYSRHSGFKVPMRCDTAGEVAALMKAKWDLAMAGGVVVANPIPAADEIPAEMIEPIVVLALKKAAQLGMSGKDVTPFLLKQIVAATDGRSLNANIALVMNNARVAAEIAVAFQGI